MPNYRLCDVPFTTIQTHPCAVCGTAVTRRRTPQTAPPDRWTCSPHCWNQRMRQCSPSLHRTASIEAIVSMRASGQTLEEIGRIVNLTRERVRQLLARESAPPPLERCPSCGSIVSRRGYTAPRTCTRCRQTKLCRLCDHTFLSTTPNAAYCNACRFATQACESCGAPITRDRGRQADRFRNKKWFCDKRCQGRWMAVHHGSGTPAGRERTIKNIGRLQTAHRAWLNKIAASASFTPSRMQDLRHSLQMTRSALAAELGVKPTSIYLWESGRRRPALQTAMLAFNEMYECRDALRAAEVRC